MCEEEKHLPSSYRFSLLREVLTGEGALITSISSLAANGSYSSQSFCSNPTLYSTTHQMRNHQFMRNDSIRRQKLRKLRKSKRRQDTHDIRIMRKVEIQALIQRKCYSVVIQSNIYLRNGRINGMVLQASEYLLHVTDSDGAASGRLKAIAACELDVDAILISEPFLVGEETAEGREAKGNGFVGAEGLGVVGVLDCPVESWS
jgi:hypothetical protein